MEKAVLETVTETLQLDINNCRGQSYDNASNMSGRYKGLQSRIKERNPLATYIPCVAHSLQLTGSAASESSEESAEFFSLEQQLYNFFSNSVTRWQVLLSKFDKHSTVLKTLSKTQWSAWSDASKALYKSYTPEPDVLAALDDISKDANLTKETRMEAKVLDEKLKTLEMTIMLCFWNNVLADFQKVSEQLQAADANLSTVVILYETLQSSLNALRNENEFQIFETEAIQRCGTAEYKKDLKRKKKPKLNFDEKREGHTEFNGRQSFLIEKYYVAVDCLKMNLQNRLTIYSEINSEFGFSWSLTQLNNFEIRGKAELLQQKYNSDLDETFPNECIHLAQFLKDKDLTGYNDTDQERMTPKQMLQLIKSLNVGSIFTNIEIILRIFLAITVTNCSGERSFSALKRVKNYLRSTLRQEKLAALAILFIENDFLSNLSFENIIENFAKTKTRKRSYM